VKSTVAVSNNHNRRLSEKSHCGGFQAAQNIISDQNNATLFNY